MNILTSAAGILLGLFVLSSLVVFVATMISGNGLSHGLHGDGEKLKGRGDVYRSDG